MSATPRADSRDGPETRITSSSRKAPSTAMMWMMTGEYVERLRNALKILKDEISRASPRTPLKFFEISYNVELFRKRLGQISNYEHSSDEELSVHLAELKEQFGHYFETTIVEILSQTAAGEAYPATSIINTLSKFPPSFSGRSPPPFVSTNTCTGMYNYKFHVFIILYV